MTQRQFNKEVRDQFKLIWGVLYPMHNCPWISYYCDKRVGGKRRRIFKSYFADQNKAEIVWKLIAAQAGDGWEAVKLAGDKYRYPGGGERFAMAQWR